MNARYKAKCFLMTMYYMSSSVFKNVPRRVSNFKRFFQSLYNIHEITMKKLFPFNVSKYIISDPSSVIPNGTENYTLQTLNIITSKMHPCDIYIFIYFLTLQWCSKA